MLEVLEVFDFYAYAVDVEGEGDWYFSDLTGGPDLGHCGSTVCALIMMNFERCARLLTPLIPSFSCSSPDWV